MRRAKNPQPSHISGRIRDRMPDLAKRTTTLDTSTRLAFDRTRVAYDRTMMAWIRTATSLITFGFGIYKFFQLELGRGRQDDRLIGTRGFSLIMVGAGLLALILGTHEHWQNMRTLREEYPDMPRSRAGVIAGLISILGVLAFIAMIFRQ
jgi:putative membrane protein